MRSVPTPRTGQEEVTAPLRCSPAWRRVSSASAPRARPPEGRLAFEIFAGGSRVGTHGVDFALHPREGCEARTRIDVRVGPAFLTLYRYRHEVRAWWRDGRVRGLRVRAAEGEKLRGIVGEPAGGGLCVRTPRSVRMVPLGIMTDIAFRNPAIVRQHRLLDHREGDLVGVEGRGGSVETVEVADRLMEAVHHDLGAESGRTASVRYDRAGRWVHGRVRIGGIEPESVRATRGGPERPSQSGQM